MGPGAGSTGYLTQHGRHALVVPVQQGVAFYGTLRRFTVRLANTMRPNATHIEHEV